MPRKAAWIVNLDHVIKALSALPQPWIDRRMLQEVLGVGPRRAQQILQPLVSLQLGASGLAEREVVIEHLRRIAASEAVYYERKRRERLSQAVDCWRRERLEQPPLFVEAPAQVVNAEFADLPSGVAVSAGRIVVEFGSPQEALEKLLALAMAIGNDMGRFEEITGGGGVPNPVSQRYS